MLPPYNLRWNCLEIWIFLVFFVSGFNYLINSPELTLYFVHICGGKRHKSRTPALVKKTRENYCIYVKYRSIKFYLYTVEQSQKAVDAFLSTERLLSFGSSEQHCRAKPKTVTANFSNEQLLPIGSADRYMCPHQELDLSRLTFHVCHYSLRGN